MGRLARAPGVLLALAGLAACAMPAPPPSAVLCPEPRRYTPAEENRAAGELLGLPSDSVIAVMIADYARERAELRACRGARR